MCGYGGKIWQTKRLVRVLTRAGYTVEVFEFSTNVLKCGNSDDLLKLADEMVFTAEKIRKQGKKEPILIGMILGALLALNILRRSTNFHTGIGITGGGIVTVAKKLYPEKWPQSPSALSHRWNEVNIYTEPKTLQDKRLFFILPTHDGLIDPCPVRDEIALQQLAGNNFQLLERKYLPHVTAIIMKTVLFPKRILTYITQVQHDITTDDIATAVVQ